MKAFKEKLIYIRQVLKHFYASYGTYLLILAKWAVAYVALSAVNRVFPGRPFLLRPIVTIAVSLLCGIMPWSYMSFVAAIWLLVQLSALSAEAAVFCLVLFLILALLRYVMLPGSGIVLVILPILFMWKLPFVVPLVVGLAGTISGFVSVGSGVLVYYALKLIAESMDYLTDPEAATLVQRLLYLVKGISENQTLWIVTLCFSVATLIVYFVGKGSMPFASQIAVVLGAFFNVILLVASFNFVQAPLQPDNLIGGTLLGLLIALIVSVFYRFLDYAKTERVQFEDDEYYYYVKAVPKVEVPQRANKRVGKSPETDTLREEAAEAEQLTEQEASTDHA